MTDTILELRKAYGRLRGLYEAVDFSGTVPSSIGEDFDRILNIVEKSTGENLSNYISQAIRRRSEGSSGYFLGVEIKSKIVQIIKLLEYGYNVNDKIVQIGSLYNSIKDRELQERCGDLLVASSHFDRVVNQATQILEQRVRLKAGLPEGIVGVDVVNKAIKANPEESVIIISNIKSEQEGFANICRGLMQLLRNETHHKVTSEYSREDAFAVCGFIDRVLRMLDSAVTKNVG